MAERLTLALPIDCARQFDSTVTQTQLTNNTFQGSSDDVDLLASMIEDAEDEFRTRTDDTMRVSRVGVAGKRETFEQITYKLSGHKLSKGTFTGTWTEYLPEESSIMLDHERLLPFDSAQGDAVYLYQGLAESGSGWEEVTSDQGDLWDIVDSIAGRFVFSPLAVADTVLTGRATHRGVAPEFLRNTRFAISYRYGGLGGERGRATATELDQDITNTGTGVVDVTDGSKFPTGQASGVIIVLIGEEYVEVVPDPANDQMEIIARGVRGTSGAAHSTGDRVQYTPPSVRKAVAARAGMQLVSAGRYSAFLPEEEDSITKGDLMDELEATFERTVEALS